MYNKKLFAERLKELRNLSGKTQKQFAEFVASTPATISAYENGTKNPSLEIVSNIARCCKVSLDWLCGLDDKKEPKKNITTYADLLDLIYELTNATLKNNLRVEIDIDPDSDYLYSKVTVALYDRSNTMKSAIEEFKAIYSLYSAKTITEEMYNTLFESLTKKYNCQIGNNNLSI